MKQYDSYKDSGVEWIGEVPSHWEVMKTSLAFHGIGSGTTPSTSKKEFYDDNDGYYWLQTGDLNDGLINDTSKKITKLAISQCNLKFYPIDSIVIAMYGATIGKVGILGIKTATNQACCVLPANKNMNFKFAFYEFLACKPALLVSAIGGGQPNISQDVIRKQKIAIPPLLEQNIIATYLDKKCSEIDNVISAQQKHIALLQELKQSVITHAVTKGLNPNVEMDATEEDWINRLPASWGKAKLKYYIHLVNGRAYSQPELLSEGKYKVLRVGNFFTNDTWYYSNMELEEDKYCNNGDLLYAWSASFGPYIWNQDKTIYHYHIWKVCYKECMDKMYVYYLLKAITNFKLGDIHGSTMVHITMESMNNSVIPIPSFDEQKDIATFLDKKCASIDNALTKAQHQVELLQKYKQSLITEVVTGKRKVC
jgi:type I restriction-modification system